MMTLDEVPLHKQVEICALHHEAHMKRRLMDLGFVCGNIVEPILASPSKGMRAYIVKGGKIALRVRDEHNIEVCEKGELRAV